MAEPRVSLRAFRTSDGDNRPIRRIVIHATCGGRGYPRESAAGVARQTAQYFQSPGAGGSAHYIEDLSFEEHCLPDEAIAWHAPPNQHSIGIEICADGGEPYRNFVPYTRKQWLSPQVWPAVERAARRTRELADRYGLPLRKLTVSQVRAGKPGICGHADVSAAFGQSSHTDPGRTFPWKEFLAAVRAKEEETMAKIISLGAGKPQQIGPGRTIGISWTVEYSDTAKLHTDDSAAILANDSFWCLADAIVRIQGIGETDRAELAWTRLSRDGRTEKDHAWGWIKTEKSFGDGDDGESVTQLGGQFQLDERCQLQLRVRNPHDYPITVRAATMAKLTLLPR
jgi:hypothetical protein